MTTSTAWALVIASFLVLGCFGYAAVTRSKACMILGAVVSAFLLNSIASQIFQAVEIRAIQAGGTIQEEEMLPDMPNLMAGLIMFGWAVFLGGYLLGRLLKRARSQTQSEHVVGGNGG